ncbi:MAG: hypothetical protein WBP64_09960 [Nitrososphaeraceae archaeon]
MDKEKCESLGINCNTLDRGAISGTAILHNVKKYENRMDFGRDRNKHFADLANFADYHYGFMIRNVNRFEKPVSYLGRLGFFEVSSPAWKGK